MDSKDPAPRKRSLTSLTLQWIADRLRRAEEIKKAVDEGAYKVDSEKVAVSLLNAENSE